MKDHEIINIGKGLFGFCFLLGNICLFGYLLTRGESFAIGGYLLLIFGSLFNLVVILGLIMYGFICHERSKVCFKAIGILLLNIPIAIVYALIGINLN